MKKDITEKVERLEAIEGKFGITLGGIYCEYEKNDDNQYDVTLNAELFASDGDISEDIEIKVAVYDNKNRLLGENSRYFYKDDFSGFDTFSLSIYSLLHIPEKIRVFPKKS